MRCKFKILMLFIIVTIFFNGSDFVVKAAVKDIQADDSDVIATDWTGVDYAVPDVYLFESDHYTAVGTAMIPYPAALRGHQYEDLWSGSFTVDFGCTLQNSYRYIFAWNGKYYPLFVEQLGNGDYCVSSYLSGFPFVNSVEEALSMADTIPSGYVFYCPLDVDLDGSLLSYRDVYTRYNESALIVQDDIGQLYRFCISDLFKYNLTCCAN